MPTAVTVPFTISMRAGHVYFIFTSLALGTQHGTEELNIQLLNE